MIMILCRYTGIPVTDSTRNEKFRKKCVKHNFSKLIIALVTQLMIMLVKVNDNVNENTIKLTIYLGCMFIKYSCTM